MIRTSRTHYPSALAGPPGSAAPNGPDHRHFERDLTTMDWLEPLMRGCLALAATGVLFAAARFRFRDKEESGAPSDLGLD
jgi:hypothetical protein